MGVAKDRSISWGIASKLAEQGADLAFTFQGEALQKRVKPLAESVGSNLVMPCDVTDENSLDETFAKLEKNWRKIDFVLHAVAYSDKEVLKGEYVETSRENFARTMDISVYSFTAIARRSAAFMNEGGSMLTLTTTERNVSCRITMSWELQKRHLRLRFVISRSISAAETFE